MSAWVEIRSAGSGHRGLTRAAPFAGAAAGRHLKSWGYRFGPTQFSDDRPRAIAKPVLMEGLAVGVEVADQDVLRADLHVVVTAGTLVELARDAEHQHHNVVVEVNAAQAQSTSRKVGVGHSE
jgi:hypothetical protein